MNKLRAAFAAILLAPFLAFAQVAVPPLTGHVVDLTGTLTQQQVQGLEQTLSAFEAGKGSQIAVLIVPTTQPETIEQYSIRVAEQWKLGRRKVDDGAILLVARNDRSLRIEVGYGLEGVLNDAVCKRIISEVIVPRFQQGDFYGGIAAGVERMLGLVQGEPLPAAGRGPAADNAAVRRLVPLLFVVTLVTSVVARALLGRLPGAVVTAGVAGLAGWWLAGLAVALLAAAMAFFFALGGWGPGGGWMGGAGGGFGRGGGGFSGGGGSFGGGGASGRW